jgi:putative cell wall-binding protein
MATIKELAEQAGMGNTLGCFWQCGDSDLERFAELIRQDERDKCAQDYLQDCSDAVEAARVEERELLKQEFDRLKKDERHLNSAETAYWCSQYKRFAQNLLDELANLDVSTKQQNVNTSDERVQIFSRNVHKPEICHCENIQRCTIFDRCMKHEKN